MIKVMSNIIGKILSMILIKVIIITIIILFFVTLLSNFIQIPFLRLCFNVLRLVVLWIFPEISFPNAGPMKDKPL